MGKKSTTKKTMKKKAMKVSKIAKEKFAKALVFKGARAKTVGGLEKGDLIKNADGRIVSKKRSQRAKKNYKTGNIGKWFKAVSAARKALGIKGFVAVGGKSPKGAALLKKVRSIYKK